MVRRRPGFYKVLRARLEAIGAGVPPDIALEITEKWVRGEITWQEAVARLRILAETVGNLKSLGEKPGA